MRTIMLLLGGLAFAATPVLASDEKPAEDPGKKIVCKGKRERVFGSSFIGNQTCKTAREWKEEETEAKRQLQHFRDNATDPGRAEGARSPQ